MCGTYSAIAALILFFGAQAGFAEKEKKELSLLELSALQAASVPVQSTMPSLQLNPPFTLDPKFEPRVRFWIQIYSKVHSWETAIHDVKMPQFTYSIVSTKKSKSAAASEKVRILNLLKNLSLKHLQIKSGQWKLEQLKPEEKKIYQMFVDAGLDSKIGDFADLKRLRGQAGLRDSLEDALFMSGRYLPRMEKVFEGFDLPKEIAYLPFVESGFNKKAVSKVGASGIWQFMPYTGKLYLRVDSVVDERNDPMRAAEAAARLMKQNFEMLGEWPLAITAYNHGAVGVAKAAREAGSKSIADIVERFESKTFGFASQNFYASFLGAMHVAKNYQLYLGEVPRARKLEFDEFVMPKFMELKVFLEKMGIEESDFRELNPALTQEVFSGRKYIPVGYTVRVPSEVRSDFLSKFENIPSMYKHSAQKEDEKPISIVR